MSKTLRSLGHVAVSSRSRALRWPILIGILPLAFALALAAASAAAQSLKGANWVRLDHNYGTVPVNDPRRVAWNLEFAQDFPAMAGWTNNYITIYNNYQVRTLVRIGHQARPTATERQFLHAASGFQCSQINALMNGLDAEANLVPNTAQSLNAIAAFILGNEPNLADEWQVDGRAYGRVHACYIGRWKSGPKSSKPLLAAGPGACHLGTCQGFYSSMFGAMGGVVDGFAIHAYGQTAGNFNSDLVWQMNLINTSSNSAVRHKPVYVTEFNAGASYGQPLPVSPTAAYFNGVYGAAANFNAGNNNQIKAVMYFVDSPDTWTRGGYQCHPAVASPPGHAWWRTSLCYNGNWRQFWLDSAPPAAPNNASVALSGVPAFMMPGQILRFQAPVTNTGSNTWSGSGSANWYRLGANGSNSFLFSAFPQCGGYFGSALNARVYTCSTVAPNSNYTYQVDARAPTSGSQAVFQARMVRDGVEWFGNSPSRTVGLGQTNCGTAVTQCILHHRPDILPFYQANGWNTACWNRDAIVNNWCGIAAGDCNALRTGSCASFNNACRCSGGLHLGHIAIDVNGTFCNYRVCGTDQRIYSCSTGNTWVNTGQTCN